MTQNTYKKKVMYVFDYAVNVSKIEQNMNFIRKCQG